jgi:hypothetical protein
MPNPAPAELLPLRRRFAEALAAASLCAFLYFTPGSTVAPDRPPLVLPVDGLIPFVPETVWVYLVGYALTFIVVLLTVRDARGFRAALAAYLAVTVAAVPFFLLWPVPASRPPHVEGVGLSYAAVRWLYDSDPAGNTFPSLHVANAALGAWITLRHDKLRGAFAVLLAIAVAVSVLTLKQHHVVDIPGGIALATLGMAIWEVRAHAPVREPAAPAMRAVQPTASRRARRRGW